MRLLLLLPWLVLAWTACTREPAPASPGELVLIQGATIASDQAPGGLTLNLNLQPALAYVVELRGKLLAGVPTLRVDTDGSSPRGMRYLSIPPEGLRFRVQGTRKLRLMIYQDTPFSYLVQSLKLKPLESPGTPIPADIFDAGLTPDCYNLGKTPSI